MKYFGLDIGSSFLKGAVLDPGARTIEHVRRVPLPEPVSGLPSRHFEIDPLAVVAAVRQLLDELASVAKDCDGVLLCGQMGGTILCGPRGEPRSNYLSWRDQRVTSPLAGQAKSSFLDELRLRLTDETWSELGNELRAGSASALLAWLVAQGQAPRPDERPCSLADFLVAQGGQTDCQMDPTEGIGLLNLDARQWHHTALRELIGADIHWPQLAQQGTPVAEWQVGGRRVPCFAPLGDHQCALAGSGLGEGELSINVSTGSQVSRLADRRATGAAQTRAYFDGWLLQTVTHLPAGRSLEVLVDLLVELPRRCGREDFDPWPAIVAAANEAPDDELEVDLAFFAGPLGDRGAIRQISVENLTVGRIFRAAWRGMARNYHECARWLSPEADWRQLVFSGGLAHKLDLFRQFACERFACPSRVCVAAEDTLQGLLALAMVVSRESRNLIDAGRQLNDVES